MLQFEGIFTANKTKTDSIQVNTIPNSNNNNLGKIVQYIGTTDSNYTNGYFYKSTKITVSEAVIERIEVNQSAGVTMADITTNLNVFKNAINPDRTWTFQFSCVGLPKKIALWKYTGGFGFLNVTRDTVFDNSRFHQYGWVDESNNYYYTGTEIPNENTVFYSASVDDVSTPSGNDSGYKYQSTLTRLDTSPFGMWIIGSNDEQINLADYGIYSASSGIVGDILQVTYYKPQDAVYDYQWQRINVQP